MLPLGGTARSAKGAHGQPARPPEGRMLPLGGTARSAKGAPVNPKTDADRGTQREGGALHSVDKTMWERLSPLLDEFLDLDEQERPARLAALRLEDAELADALAAMLGHLPEIEREGFLDEPAIPRPAGLEGQTIGAYMLVRELGHGGMGTVWLARRTDGRYEGEVAIKFLRTGLFGHGDAARFEREGSILARLSHPHIARLLDAGISPDGTQPYLVLEYIDGEPIDVYCRRFALSTAARLRLFLDVLAAVAHAHNRLILHRDLKPSNIFVTGAGEVKLLDFGIAKLLDDTANEATALTAHAGNAFTPDFAAPEQLQGGDVTTATDVYALGVLMFMLLGGEHPTVAPTGAPLDRMRAVIEMEPKRLSDSVLRRGGPRSEFSPASKKLSNELKGDVDTIVARALKKSPTERYANAADLADDVRRYLAHEPIAARPDARLYRLAKFMRRHRAGVATASIAVLALGIGAGVALWQAREASRQRVQAEGLIEFMLGDLRKKLEPVGRLDVLDSVGDKALAYYAAQDLGRLDADSLGRRARALHMIGDLAEQRGKLEEAQRDFQQAADSTDELLKREPRDGQRVFDHSQSEYWIGYIQWRRGRDHDAEAAFQRYYALAEKMVQIAPANLDWRLEKVYAAQNLATLLIELGRPVEALAMCTQSRDLMKDIVAARPDEAVDEAHIVGWIARADVDLGRYDEAVAAENAKIALARGVPGSAGNQDAQYLIASGHAENAHWLLDLGRTDDALALARQGLAEHERLAALDPSNTDWLSEVIGTNMFLADVLMLRGDLAGARASLDQVRAPLAELMARPLPKRSWRVTQTGHADLLRARLASTPAERADAQKALSGYLADVRRYEQEGSEVTADDLLIVAPAGMALGDLLAAEGHADQARAAWMEAAARVRPDAEHLNPAAMTTLALLDLRMGNTQDARALADSVQATSYRHPAFADLQKQLGQAQQAGETSRPRQGNP